VAEQTLREVTRSLGRYSGGDMLEEIWTIAKKGVYAYLAGNALSHGAAIAFYAVTGFVPALIVTVALLSAVFGADLIRAVVGHALHVLMGHEASAVTALALKGMSGSTAGFHAELVGGLILIVTASGAFGEIQAALNAVWGVQPPMFTVARFLRARVTSLVLVAGLGALLLVSIVATAAIAILAPRLHFELGAASALLPIANFLFSLVLATALFATVYKVLPDIDLEWSDVIVGAAVTALLYEIGQLLIGFYLEQRSGLPAYGATGATIVLLLWIYYSSQIFLLGAELTRVYATRRSPAGRFRNVETVAT